MVSLSHCLLQSRYAEKIIQPFFNHKPRKKPPTFRPFYGSNATWAHGKPWPCSSVQMGVSPVLFNTEKSQDIAHNDLENQEHKGNTNPKPVSFFFSSDSTRMKGLFHSLRKNPNESNALDK